ncbi:MAG: apolipoprotein N-acyltransferase [Pseudomonadota bacterium]
MTPPLSPRPTGTSVPTPPDPPPEAAPELELGPVRRAVERRRSGPALAFGLGALAALGQAPVSWPWLAMLAFAVAFGLFSMQLGWRRAAWRGWAMGTGYFAVALFWIVEPFLVDPLRHGWMAPFALVFMAGGLALFWAAAFGLAHGLGASGPGRALWLAVGLTTAEIARSVVLTGFPWALVGHIWIGWPQMHLAALGGADALTLVTLTAAALPAIFGARKLMLGAIAGAALAALPGGYAALRVPDVLPLPADDAPMVRLVQPNAPQHLKWRPDMIGVFWERALALTAEPAAGRPTDLVIWPETSVPYLLKSAAPGFERMAEAAGRAKVAAGLQRRDDAGAWRNSLVTLDATGAVTGLYDKHHLVPFGEYMPLAALFERWGIFGLAANIAGSYARGPGPQILDLGRTGRAMPLICYEAIFARDIRAAPARPDWLMHVTNDAWFGQLSGPYQHLAQAQLRAVEFGLPVLRAANTGVSAVIDAHGQIRAELPLGTHGALDATLPPPLPETFYARYGAMPVTVALLLLAGVATGLSRAAGLATRRGAA